MTTNGFFLFDKVDRLVQAGLKRINVSVDSLQPARFERMVRRDGQLVFKILEGCVGPNSRTISHQGELRGHARVQRRRTAGFRPSWPGGEFSDPLHRIHAARRPGRWSMQTVVPGAEILARIEAAFPVTRESGHGSEPATVYPFADGRGSIGVIASVTEPFCDYCNRVRITADGHLRTCLFSLSEHDLKGLLRSGATDDELADFIIAAVWKKEAGIRSTNPTSSSRIDPCRPSAVRSRYEITCPFLVISVRLLMPFRNFSGQRIL